MKWQKRTRRVKFEPPAAIPEHQLLLDRRQAASILGVSPSTLDRLVRAGILTPLRLNRRPMYPRASVEKVAGK